MKNWKNKAAAAQININLSSENSWMNRRNIKAANCLVITMVTRRSHVFHSLTTKLMRWTSNCFRGEFKTQILKLWAAEDWRFHIWFILWVYLRINIFISSKIQGAHLWLLAVFTSVSCLIRLRVQLSHQTEEFFVSGKPNRLVWKRPSEQTTNLSVC